MAKSKTKANRKAASVSRKNDRPAAQKPAKLTRAAKSKAANPSKTGKSRAIGPARAKTPDKARANTKQAILIARLQHKDGATIDDLVKATGWQAHSVRGAISGTLKKKLGLDITSEKVEGRGRVYCVSSAR